MESENFIHRIGQILADKKAMNVMALDVRGTSALTEFFIIAEGSVGRHVKALAQAVSDEIRQQGRSVHFIEGVEDGEWVVIDAWDVVVHVFIPELRQKYQLERLWEEGEIVDLKIHWTGVEGAVASPPQRLR